MTLPSMKRELDISPWFVSVFETFLCYHRMSWFESSYFSYNIVIHSQFIYLCRSWFFKYSKCVIFQGSKSSLTLDESITFFTINSNYHAVRRRSFTWKEWFCCVCFRCIWFISHRPFMLSGRSTEIGRLSHCWYSQWSGEESFFISKFWRSHIRVAKNSCVLKKLCQYINKN